MQVWVGDNAPGLILLALILLVAGDYVFRQYQDYSESEVQEVQGRVEKRIEYARIQRHILKISNLKFQVNGPVWRAVQSDTEYIAYYTPHTHSLVGLEIVGEDGADVRRGA